MSTFDFINTSQIIAQKTYFSYVYFYKNIVHCWIQGQIIITIAITTTTTTTSILISTRKFHRLSLYIYLALYYF